jgi:phosphatidylglycerophosphate synthase
MKRKLHYFLDKESEKQQQFAEMRTRMLTPFLKVLDRFGFTPGFISFFALSLIIPFAILYPFYPVIACLFLWSYVVLDGVDGSLARYKKIDNAGGSLIDIVCDQTGLLVCTGMIIHYDYSNHLIAYLYGCAYIIMIALGVAQNYLNLKLRFNFRSKFMVYIIFTVYAFFPSIDVYMILFVFLGFSTVVMTITNIIGYNLLIDYFSKR